MQAVFIINVLTIFFNHFLNMHFTRLSLNLTKFNNRQSMQAVIE